MEGKSQSRYGIMDELNTKKIEAKQTLATIESNMDSHVYKIENAIENIKRAVEDKGKVYKREFNDWKRQEEVQLNLMKADYERQKANKEERIAEKEASYEPDFKTWKEEQLTSVKKFEEDLARYKKTQEKAIKDQEAIIAEYDKSILDLKEMSKEKAE